MSPHAAYARTAVSANALLWSQQGTLLLVRERGTGLWDVPGGYSTRGESPRDACDRELREELGIEPRISQLLVVDWAPLPGVGDKLIFLFSGGRLSQSDVAAITIDEEELDSWRFFEPEEALVLLPRRIRKRVQAGLRAKTDGTTIYLENGKCNSIGVGGGRA